MNKFLILFFIIPSIIFANLIDDYTTLSRKERKTFEENINLISIIYKMGYPEKAKLSLYHFIKESRTKEYKKISKLLMNNFDSKTIKTLNYLSNPKDEKDKNLDNELINSTKIEVIKKIEIKDKTVEKKEIHLETKTRLNPKTIDEAIMISENLDNIDYLRVQKQVGNFKHDRFFILLHKKLVNRDKKDIDDDKIISLNLPEGYHYLYSFYKKKNPEKSKKYRKIIEKNYPTYLKYNKL